MSFVRYAACWRRSQVLSKPDLVNHLWSDLRLLFVAPCIQQLLLQTQHGHQFQGHPCTFVPSCPRFKDCSEQHATNSRACHLVFIGPVSQLSQLLIQPACYFASHSNLYMAQSFKSVVAAESWDTFAPMDMDNATLAAHFAVLNLGPEFNLALTQCWKISWIGNCCL